MIDTGIAAYIGCSLVFTGLVMVTNALSGIRSAIEDQTREIKKARMKP